MKTMVDNTSQKHIESVKTAKARVDTDMTYVSQLTRVQLIETLRDYMFVH